MIMVAVPGTEMSPDIDRILKEYLPGGVILFGYNLSSFEGNKKLIRDMQDAACGYSGMPLFVSIDQEGGRVVRIVSGVTQFPGAMAAGVSGVDGLAYRWGRSLGVELRMTGVNMNLAPVLDVNNNPRNPVINTRSFGSDPGLVAELGAAYLLGLQASRCIAVGKHFPGHGDTDIDSHLELPVIRYDMERLSRVELVPFKKAVAAGLECMMTAHIAYPLILGSDDPATVSKRFLTGMLRDEMRFRGLVITDDMEMHAISRRQELGEAAVRSILAGADIILISSYERSIPAIVGAITAAVREKRVSMERIDASVTRIIETKIRYGIASCKDGTCGQAAYVPADADRKALADAERVNEALSRRGILYFGPRELLRPPPGTVRVFVTKSGIMRHGLAGVNNGIIVDSIGALPASRALKGKRAVMYLHMAQPDLSSIRRAAAFCAKRGVDLVLVSSGNPFPATVSGIVTAGLLSFSDTGESVRQLARCLKGAFEPATGGSLLLGVGDER
ncbi:MAG: glycoside hydrolase family 3 protein [Spirochaetes bacterium]|nr:glycoside hydrolase family 3 protein [Spirochaetota bacterium]